MVRPSSDRKAQLKASDIQELEVQLEKRFYCGSCNYGFQTIEEYKEHCNEEEHNYHITRRIVSLVPGLGFCPACSCLIQTAKGWDKHTQTPKHAKCIESLNAIGIFGQYDRPLGCDIPGELGLPIESYEIDQKVSASHGYGHGGKMNKNVPLIGLNFLTELELDEGDEMPKYNCDVCCMKFTFEHRSKHLTGIEHRTKYLKKYYEKWYKDFIGMHSEMRSKRQSRLMWYAYKVEKMELDSETETAKELRDKFVNVVTQKKESNKLKAAVASNHGRPREVTRGTRGGIRGARYPTWRGGFGPPMMKGPRPGMRPRNFLPVSTLPMSTLPRSRGSRGPCPRRLLTRMHMGSSSFGEEEGYYGDLDSGTSLGKRPLSSSHGSYKKYKEDPYSATGGMDQFDDDSYGNWDETYDPYEEPDHEDADYSKALEAIEVLETFATSKAKGNIKEKIDSMKNAVLEESGVSLESIRRSRGQSRGRGSRGLETFPPRPLMGGPPSRMSGPRHRGPLGPPRGMRPMRPPMTTLPMMSSSRGVRRGRGMRPPLSRSVHFRH